MRVRARIRKLMAALSLTAALFSALLLPLSAPAAAEHLGYALYHGGAHPATVTSATWEIHDIVYGGVLPGAGGSVSALSLKGTHFSPPSGCAWAGINSEAGSLTVQPSGRTYTLFNVVVDATLNGINMETTGQWSTPDGAAGVFAAIGYIDYAVGHPCGIFFDGWAFAQSNTDPADLIAYLEDQLPDNNAPGVPELIAPSDGATYQPGQIQVFTVQATDPDGETYAGRIFVKRPGATGFDPSWSTVPAQSGQTSSGTPAQQYPSGSGYTWKARAFDGRLESPDSTTRTFNVL